MKRWMLGFLAWGAAWGQTPSALFYEMLPEWNGTVEVRDMIPFAVDHDPIVGTLFGVPAGTFVQGSPVDEPCRNSDETQFTHTLTRSLLVMETEVTRQMWADLKAAQPSLPVDPTSLGFGSGMNNPVQNNTWYEALLFANLLSLERDLTRCYYMDAAFVTPVDVSNYTSGSFYCDFDASGYRLPTEGEWEYFTRGGTTGPFSVDEPNYTHWTCGNPYCVSSEFPNLELVAVFCANDTGGTSPAGSENPNPHGLRDVHGNVWEWCWDRYSLSYPSGTATDYAGASSGSSRVFRGGSWRYDAWVCRSGDRIWDSTGARSNSCGFRLVRTNPGN